MTGRKMIIEFDDATGHCPVAPDTVSHWCETLLKAEQQSDIEVAIRIVDANESQTLNRTYRGKDSPTNVDLSCWEISPFAGLSLSVKRRSRPNRLSIILPTW